ncbi:twin transmembrane helix small protein [Nitrosospira sp. NpAV]|uniref:twin transmembrane helix small protein n=1 Tax=Nitrosospira sp. NpAV TaxID=58133 RepID=UPI00059F939E|nr:twin transmembrane helix small protein [Nitrosospira sp. NpAV]KIO48011.1 membrane protein [Nitrosospira sp. NpAV]
MKIVVALFLFFILTSLASALYYLVKDKGQGTRTVRSLTFRIGLSMFLFALLMTGTYLGFIPLQ